ncbi:putative membrane protein YdbT with pleckstrin-like domain [Microbacterium sp. SORGH_AS 1204]|uniref:hypothetical protein n=1 Tax=Microbacterium sp. SORGH_AS_1204 TaxID=3041785 RepID=UPI00278CD333|nr:hypothetical protein [Microbacterium sp. SORGH_AS_1204]MDQ1138461.1 putative membrane protein YdbT with pleckstrin-like domain [Microbacterium sp. SORGH_AS_1204]
MGDAPPPIASRFFRACLLILGGVVALWLALELFARLWGWVLLAAGIVLTAWCLVTAYRYWWGRRF